jgi:hypothetical protein
MNQILRFLLSGAACIQLSSGKLSCPCRQGSKVTCRAITGTTSRSTRRHNSAIISIKAVEMQEIMNAGCQTEQKCRGTEGETWAVGFLMSTALQHQSHSDKPGNKISPASKKSKQKKKTIRSIHSSMFCPLAAALRFRARHRPSKPKMLWCAFLTSGPTVPVHRDHRDRHPWKSADPIDQDSIHEAEWLGFNHPRTFSSSLHLASD